MTPPAPVPVVSVRGGSHGIEAHYDQMVDTARRFGAVATDAGGAAVSMHRYLLDGEILASSVLDPAGYAVFIADLGDALDGAHGLSWAATRAGLIDGELRTAALLYEGADKLTGELREVQAALAGLPAAAIDALVAWVGSGAPFDRAALPASVRLLAQDPYLVDALMDAGLISVDELVAADTDDGHANVRATGLDARAAALTPPRGVADLLSGLSLRNHGEHGGAIDIKFLDCPDGTRRVIVDIPGTKSWALGHSSDITSFSTNARALIGERTAYEQGVLAAMTQAGVRPGDHVMLVGHSEGGMVAVETARDAVANGSFDVTHVVTAGSPIAITAAKLPDSVQVLALENAHDFVPHLDGAANPDRTNITTVTISHGDGSEGDDHSLPDSYIPGGADVDASDNPSIKDYLTGAGGYFSATAVTTHTYRITREY